MVELFTDKSTVELVDHMGDDKRAACAARASFAKDTGWEGEVTKRDEKLIGFLIAERHSSPFEHSTATFRITCPLYVAMQFLRHRTFSYSMLSRRYSSDNLQLFMPSSLRLQAEKNLQCSLPDTHPEQELLLSTIKDNAISAVELYNALIDSGVCREQARGVLPQNMMTTFWMTGNLWNWIKFLNLRTAEDVQPESRVVASEIQVLLTSLFPLTINEFIKVGMLS
jgi:thymidylate synthase (FAD)